MTPKLTYDKDGDIAYLRFAEEKIVESEEVRPGVIFDFDEGGHIVAIEILDARDKLGDNTLASVAAA